MNNITLTFIALANLVFLMKPNINVSGDKIEVEIQKRYEQKNSYKVSIYNNSDSVLCLITSLYGNYKKDSISILVPWSKTTEGLIYKIDYNLNDTKYDPQLPIKRKICILPYQAVSFSLNLTEEKPKMSLQMEYFYSNSYNHLTSNDETKKPLWYKKYKTRILTNEFPR